MVKKKVKMQVGGLLPSKNKTMFRCSFCTFHCRCSADLHQHEKNFHQESDHMAFDSVEPRIEKLDKKLKCLMCNKKYSHLYYLTRHLKSHVGEQRVNKLSLNVLPGKCIDTPKTTPKLKKALVCTNVSFSCLLCKKTFDCRRSLQEHEANLHPEERSIHRTTGPLLQSDTLFHATDDKGVTFIQSGRFTSRKCEHSFLSKAQLHSHICSKLAAKTLSCPKCSYTCRRKQYLKRHMLTHSGEKAHLCTVCGYAFMFPESLKNHMHTHATEKPLSCDICSFSTSDPNALTRHVAKHISNLYTCTSCTYSCLRKKDFDQHVSTHHPPQCRFDCSSCNVSFSALKELQAHVLTHVEKICPNYKCKYCEFNCKIQKDYIYHMETHSVDKPFACEICDYTSNRRINLKLHMKRQHKLALTNMVTFTCNVCSFSCDRDRDYVKHMHVVHSVDKPFYCPVCPYSSKRQNLLKVHLETHQAPRFACSLCDFKCKRKTLLNQHVDKNHCASIENVVEEKDGKCYKCKDCDFSSRHYASLRNHLPVHSGIIYSCKECSYSTHSKRNLASHKLTHIREKPFKCPFCNYCSARKNNFKIHMVKHIKEKLFYCQKCDFFSKNQEEVSAHIVSCHANNSVLSEQSVESWRSSLTLCDRSASTPVQMEPGVTGPACINTGSDEEHVLSSVKVLSLKSGALHESEQSHAYECSKKTSSFSVISVTESQSNNTCCRDDQHPISPTQYTPLTSVPTLEVVENLCDESSGLLPVRVLSCVQTENVREERNMTYGDHTQFSRTCESSADPSQEAVYYNPVSEASSSDHQPLPCNPDCAPTLDSPISQHRSKPHQQHVDQNTDVIINQNHEISSSDIQMQALNQSQDEALVSQFQCQVKNQSDQNFVSLQSISNYQIKLLSCKFCGFCCSEEQELGEHMDTHLTQLSFACMSCGNAFSSLKELQQHLAQGHPALHKANSPYILDNFQDAYSTLVSNISTDDTIQVCGTKTQANSKQYSCVKCSFMCARPSEFKRHMWSVHAVEKAFTCNVCSYSTKREDDLKIHSITHDEGISHSCSLCDYTCKRTPALRKHMNQKHMDVKLFSCDLCEFWCNYEPDLKSHKRRCHEKPKLFSCKTCQFFCEFAVSFKKHMSLVHSIERCFACPLCEYSTHSWNNYRAHRSKHSDLKQFKCQVCGYSCKRPSTLKNHMLKHSNSKVISCPECNYRCSLPEKLNSHMSKHNKEKQYVCGLCQRSYAYSSSLHKHISVVHKNGRRFNCTACAFTTFTQTHLRRHLFTHGMGKRFHCSVCHFACNHSAVLANHQLLHNTSITSKANLCTPDTCTPSPGNGPESSYNSSDVQMVTVTKRVTNQLRKIFNCCICDVSFVRPHELKIHTYLHTGEQPFTCNMCDFACNKPIMLKYHKMKAHPAFLTNKTAELKKKFSCPLCQYIGKTRWILKYHILNKHKASSGNKSISDHNTTDIKSGCFVRSAISCTPVKESSSVEANDSEKTTPTIKGRKSQRRNPGFRYKKFVCTMCSYSSVRRGNLLIHMQRHAEKKFLCHMCEYTCCREQELKRHLLTHSTSKPLSCKLCSYTCIQSASLKVHMLKHSGEKPIQCQLCDFRCRQSSTLRDHMTTHSDARPFACTECEYTAKRAVCLKMHMLTHSSEKPISCDLCDFTCKHANALRSHMRSHANDKFGLWYR